MLRYAYLVPLLERGYRPDDIAAGHRALMSDPTRVAEAQADDADAGEQSDPWASHPPTAVRIQRVAALADERELERDERAARVLWREPDRWIAAAHDRWLRSVTSGKTFEVVPWDSWGTLVAEATQSDRAAVVDRALARLELGPGVDGVHEALTSDRERELASALVAEGWRADQRDQLVRAALMSTAARDAVEQQGCAWAMSWSGPVALRTKAGADVDVTAWANEVLAGTWRPLVGRARRTTKRPAARATSAASSSAVVAMLPEPPQPAFAPGDNGWKWVADLPSGVGRNAIVQVGDDAFGLNGKHVRYDELASFAVSVRSDSGSGVKVQISAAPADGAAAKITSSSVTQKGARPAYEACGYLWDVVTARAGQRLSDAYVAQVESGSEVAVGGFVVSKAGIATAKKPRNIVAWSDIRDPDYVDGHVVIPASPKGLVVKMGEPNAFVLDQLIPQLRSLYA